MKTFSLLVPLILPIILTHEGRRERQSVKESVVFCPDVSFFPFVSLALFYSLDELQIES